MTLSEHRAAARIAWRQARRAKARTALIIALVGLPIAALAASGFVIQSALPGAEDKVTAQLGSADLGINYYSHDLTVDEVQQALPPGSRVTYSRALNFTRIIDGGQYGLNIVETSAPADQPPLRARYITLKGRMPQSEGEAALHPRLARILDVEVGDELRIDEFEIALRVVGFAALREELRNLTFLVGPHTLDRAAATTKAKHPSQWSERDVFPVDWLIDLPPHVTPQEAVPDLARTEFEGTGRFGFTTRQFILDQYRTERLTLTGAAFGGAVGALFGTGLIAAAAFAVGARRQLRTLGLVGVAGGDGSHARAIVLWGGTLMGAVGSAVGVAVAVAVAYAVTPHIDLLVGRVAGPVRVPWAAIAGALALGTVAATLAALGPARHAARVTTVDALAGRIPKPKPAGRLARRGLIVIVAGGTLAAAGAAWRQEKILAVAFVITLIGFLLAIPLLVSSVGRLPARLPASLRLAARQTARHGRRTGAAVAAATLALTAPVAIAAYTRSDEAFNDRRIPIGDHQLLLSGANDKAPDEHREILSTAREAIPGSVVAAIRNAVSPSTRPGAAADEVVPWYVQGPEIEVETGVFESESGSLAIGDAAVLRAIDAVAGIAPLQEGKIVAVRAAVEGDSLTILSADDEAGSSGGIDVPAVAVGRPKQTNEGEVPRYFISEQAASRYGLRPGLASAGLLRAPHALSDEEIGRVQRAISRCEGTYATSRENFMFHATPVRLLITAAATFVALIIIGVAVALVAAESRREYALVVALGAGLGMRRRTVAANAFFVTALAGILAVPAGLLPVAIVEVARTQNQPIVVPWDVIGIVMVGAPLVAGLIAAAFSRQPPSRALLQPAW
ncbi:MAG: FtsX-like permease family protein [Actinomycetota bacterium]